MESNKIDLSEVRRSDDSVIGIENGNLSCFFGLNGQQGVCRFLISREKKNKLVAFKGLIHWITRASFKLKSTKSAVYNDEIEKIFNELMNYASRSYVVTRNIKFQLQVILIEK